MNNYEPGDDPLLDDAVAMRDHINPDDRLDNEAAALAASQLPAIRQHIALGRYTQSNQHPDRDANILEILDALEHAESLAVEVFGPARRTPSAESLRLSWELDIIARRIRSAAFAGNPEQLDAALAVESLRDRTDGGKVSRYMQAAELIRGLDAACAPGLRAAIDRMKK